MFFFFKQKTAYEMRISDWSSDVCSSDLIAPDMATMLGYIFTDAAVAPALLQEMLSRATGGSFNSITVEIGKHTSELQSLMRISYAVFCLKKKIKKRQIINSRVNTSQNTI